MLRLGLGRFRLRRRPVYRRGLLSSPPLGALPVAAHGGTHLVEEALLTHAARFFAARSSNPRLRAVLPPTLLHLRVSRLRPWSGDEEQFRPVRAGLDVSDRLLRDA